MRVLILMTLWASPAIALSQPSVNSGSKPKATVTTLDTASARQVPSGKAKIKILAQGENAFVGQLWLAAGGAVPVHRDPTEEYIYVVSGSGKITIDGRTTEIGPGATVYMPANAEVSFKNGEQPLVAIQIFAGTESAKKYDRWAPITKAKSRP